jgi:hypothetical protein
MGTEERFAGDVREILDGIAADLTPAVVSFLHGGAPGSLPKAESYVAASIRLRRLHDALSDADRNRRGKYVALVLATAVRLQALILYETLKEKYGAYAGSA